MYHSDKEKTIFITEHTNYCYEIMLFSLKNVCAVKIKWYNMKLSPSKCTFKAGVGKFFGFMLIVRGIKANLDKCIAISGMKSPQSPKEVQRLTCLSRFIPCLAEKVILKVMKEQTYEKWEG